MKVFMVHVGNVINGISNLEDSLYLKRKEILSGEFKYFKRHDVINADIQMWSLVDAGIEIDYGHFSNRKSISASIKAGKIIRKKSKAPDVDLVHVLWGTTTALVTVLFSKKPVIVSFCGSDLLGAKDVNGKITKSGLLNRFVSKFVSRISSWNITKSEQMKSTLPISGQKKTSVIPNGISLVNFYPMDRNEACVNIGVDPKKKRILFFYSENQDVKNPEMAKKIFEIVGESICDVELFVATGISHDQLVYYYNACDIMILTSFHEGSNNSLKEAKACNLPIVSTDVGDARERLQSVKNCYVLDSWDPYPFAEKVIDVLENNERSDGADHSRDVAIDVVAKSIIEVYKKVLNKDGINH